MIRKLRWKFVAVCMGLVALVLSAVFGAAYHAVRQNIEDLSRQMLYQVLREDSGRGAVPNPTIEIGGDRVLLPYFTVNIWGDTAYITGGTYADLENTDTLRDILSQCLEQEAAEGTVNEYHLRYLSMDNGLYRKLAFVDMSMEQAVLIRLVRSYLVIALAAMLALLAIAVAASHWVTRPVERAWKQQRQFLSDASHELKTPISAILMSLQLLEDKRVGALNDEQEQLSKSIKENADRLLGITGELLNMTQVEAGKLQMMPKITKPIELIEYAIKANQVQADKFGIQIEVEYPEEKMPKLFVDSEKIAWVLTNLLSNAVRYSKENGRVVIGAKREEDFVELYVQDFGKGIDPRYHQSIFDRYFRVPGTKVQGSGLGLSISKDFVEAHGGTLTVESELGKGSKFIMRLKA